MESQSVKGVRALTTGASQMTGGLFANPLVAASLGVVFGALLIVVARWASRLVKPEDPTIGFAQVAMISFGRLMFALAAMVLFYIFARKGFIAFSVSLIVTFMCALAYEAFRASHTLSSK